MLTGVGRAGEAFVNENSLIPPSWVPREVVHGPGLRFSHSVLGNESCRCVASSYAFVVDAGFFLPCFLAAWTCDLDSSREGYPSSSSPIGLFLGVSFDLGR